jgi:hypothetical protein
MICNVTILANWFQGVMTDSLWRSKSIVLWLLIHLSKRAIVILHNRFTIDSPMVYPSGGFAGANQNGQWNGFQAWEIPNYLELQVLAPLPRRD